jgi:hypothetical protein
MFSTDHLASLGRLSIRHGDLDFIVEYAIQCLDPGIAEDSLNRFTFSRKTELLKQLAPRASALIARINEASGERNRIMHSHTTFNVDLNRVRFKYKGQNVPASTADIDKIANKLFDLTAELYDTVQAIPEQHEPPS